MNVNYLAVSNENQSDFFVTDNLNNLISEMYECELLEGHSFETVEKWFHSNFVVFKSESKIEEVVFDGSN